VKYVAISKQWATAVEVYEGNCRRCDAVAKNTVYRTLQDLQVLGYWNKSWALALWSERIETILPLPFPIEVFIQ